MVNILGNKDNGLKAVQKSLDDNLNIIASDSRLKTIVDKIVDSRYRIKSLSEIILSSITAVFGSYIVDGKVFLIPTTAGGVGNIEVRDYQFDTLLTTINTGATQTSTAVTYDASYIYISCIKDTPKSVYIQRYNRCTLAFIDEYLLYQNDTPTFNKMLYRDGYIYCQCAASTGTQQHRIRKWNTTTFATDVSVYFDTPTDLSLSDYGLVVSGRNVGTNANDLQKPAILNYSDLLTSKLFPKTTLTQQNWRPSLVIDNKLYIANDAGVICRYNVDTLAAEVEIAVAGGGVIRGLSKFKDVGILITNSFGYAYLYDFNLALIKKYDFSPTSTSGVHVAYLDGNNTYWYHSYQYAKVYKKQIIDMTSDVI